MPRVSFKYDVFEVCLEFLDELSPLPEILFDQVIGDANQNYIQRIILEQSQESEKKRFLICHEGTYSPITEQSCILIKESLYFCTGRYVCKWNINLMQLEWELELDMSCCFFLELMGDQKTILVSGELELSRINFDGNILWSYSGSDIFVTESGDVGAEIIKDKIYITDWSNILHILDLNGNLLQQE